MVSQWRAKLLSIIVKNCVCNQWVLKKTNMRWIYEALNIWLYFIWSFSFKWISQTRPLLTKPSTRRKTQKGFRENGGKKERIPSKKTPKPQRTTGKGVLMNSSRTPTCSCINGNAVRLRVASYPSCWGLGWGRCGVYSGPKRHRKATARTGGGCCWPSAVPGQAEGETPSCSGWGWRAGSGRTRAAAAAAAAAAGTLWLVDCHYSVGMETQLHKSSKVALFWIHLSPSNSSPENET